MGTPLASADPTSACSLRYGLVARVLVVMLVVILGGALVLVVENTPAADASVYLVPIAVLLAALPLMRVFVARWQVDQQGIEQPKTIFRLHRRMAWADVTEVSSVGRTFVVSTAIGAPFVIRRSLRGIDAFAYFVQRHVPASLVPLDATRRRLAYCSRRLLPIVPHAFAPEPASETPSGVPARHDPFLCLGLSPDCSRADVERAGQKLLGLLAIGSSAAKTYASPDGLRTRTEDMVRAAMAELRDPERRIVHEAWVRLAPATLPAEDPPSEGWQESMAALGFERG